MKKKKFVKLNKPVKPVKKQKPDEQDEIVKPDSENEPEEEPASKLCDCGKPVQPGSYQCAECAHRA